jgi:hypothetical protein
MLFSSSVADPGCFIPDPDLFPMRIPDPNIFHSGSYITRVMKNKNTFIRVSEASFNIQKDNSSQIRKKFIQDPGREKAPDPGSGSTTLFSSGGKNSYLA